MKKNKFAKFAKWAPLAALFFQPHSGPAVEPQSIRKSALAGSWYPADPGKLKNRLALYLERVGQPDLNAKPFAIIVPHAGYMYSAQAAAYAYKALENSDIGQVIILGISHYYPLIGAALPEADFFETPLGLVPVDKESIKKLITSPLFKKDALSHEREHSLEIQIPFLQMVLKKGFKIVPIAVGSLKPGDFALLGQEIKKIMGPRTLIVASSDFVHYGPRFDYVPSLKNIPSTIEKIDRGAIDQILKKDSAGFIDHCEKTGATICGRNPIAVLLKILPPESQGTLLRYYRSGDITGDWDNSVSYASFLFTVPAGKKEGPPIRFINSENELRQKEMLTVPEQKALINLARQTIESFVRDNKVPDSAALASKYSGGLQKNLGVFVTLQEHGQLRGCIGSIQGREPLYQGVINNAVNSCARDTRFNPVQAKELNDIHIEISVLSPLKKAESAERILPGWTGVVLQKGPYQAVYLPQVPLEVGWDRDEMLSNLAEKAGLGPDDWKSDAQFFTFEAQIFSEEK